MTARAQRLVVLITGAACFSIAPVLMRAAEPTPAMSLCESYIAEWVSFYPSKALSAGHRASAGRFEDFSDVAVSKWIDTNREFLGKLDAAASGASDDDRIDLRLLRRGVLSEIEQWESEKAHQTSPTLYSETISQAMTFIIGADLLGSSEKLPATMSRLEGIRRLCAEGRRNLRDGRPDSTARAIPAFEASAAFIESDLSRIAADWGPPTGTVDLKTSCTETAASIRKLRDHIKTSVLPSATLPDALGHDAYARQFRIYTGSDMRPNEAEKAARDEIAAVRTMMVDLATAWWRETQPDEPVPAPESLLLEKAMAAMEADRESDTAQFLVLYRELAEAAEAFVREKGWATTPEKRTLTVLLSPPHFGGAAVGGVYPAGPFSPDSQTLYYIPTMPDSAPADAREGFYRSFNNHFNRMITPHELFPGHYLQCKIAASLARRIRSLFADELYVEGWATLCESLALDLGWSGDAKLTRLAHLRKRLENAVRTYASIKVHCGGCSKKQLTEFAVTTGLLPPQFAANLWNRVMDTPFQVTSYFLGSRAFRGLLESEKQRLWSGFSLRGFSDAVLQSGPIPIDELPRVLRERTPWALVHPLGR